MTEQEQQEMAQDYAEAAQVVSFHGNSVCCTVCMDEGKFDSLLVIDSVDPDEVNGIYSLTLHCVFCSTVFQADFELYEEVEYSQAKQEDVEPEDSRDFDPYSGQLEL